MYINCTSPDNYANYSNCFLALEIHGNFINRCNDFLPFPFFGHYRCHATKEQTSKPFTRGRVLGRSALKLFSAEEGFGLLPMLVS